MRIAWIVLALLLTGCAAETKRLEEDKAMQAAGRTAELAARTPPCDAAKEVCGQAQEIRGDACRTLAQADPPFSAQRGVHLECAVAAYGAAAQGLSGPARERALRNAGSAANDAVTEGAGNPAIQAAMELSAGVSLVQAHPGDPEGCYYAGSALLAQALMRPEGPGRCPVLQSLPASCAGAPAWPGRETQSRQLFQQLAQQRQRNQCP